MHHICILYSIIIGKYDLYPNSICTLMWFMLFACWRQKLVPKLGRHMRKSFLAVGSLAGISLIPKVLTSLSQTNQTQRALNRLSNWLYNCWITAALCECFFFYFNFRALSAEKGFSQMWYPWVFPRGAALKCFHRHMGDPVFTPAWTWYRLDWDGDCHSFQMERLATAGRFVTLPLNWAKFHKKQENSLVQWWKNLILLQQLHAAS